MSEDNLRLMEIMVAELLAMKQKRFPIQKAKYRIGASVDIV